MADNISDSRVTPDVMHASDLNQVKTCLPDALLDDGTISPLAKMAYWYLKRHGGRRRASEISTFLGLSIRDQQVWNHLSELAAAGWIDVATYNDGTPVLFIVHEVPAVER